MILLILGLVLWSAVHLLPVMAPARRKAVSDAIGVVPSKGVAAVLLIGSTVLMVRGYSAADPVLLWVAPSFLWHINNLLMVIAIFVFIAGSFPSVVRRVIRHPQLTGLKIWALAHLLVNGDLPSLVLFGGLLAWAVVAMIAANRRDGPRGKKPVATTKGLILHVVAAGVVTVLVMLAHLKLGGVSPFPV